MIPTPSSSRRIGSERSAEPIPFASPLGRPGSAPGFVSLREIKQIAEEFGPTHPLRLVLLGEPDEMPDFEFRLKLRSWVRLLRLRVD